MPSTAPADPATDAGSDAPGPPLGEAADRSRAALRRVVAIAGAALGLYVVAAAAIVYVFSVRRWGYFFFDISDVALYFRYAAVFAQGARPYVHVGVEYPPLAVSLFALPGPPYQIDSWAPRFALHMFVFGAAASVVTSAIAARLWPRGREPYAVGAAFAVAVLATGALVANRFDVVVALVIATALLFLARGWPAAAGGALGLGFALKLVPAILLPLVLVLAATRRGALRAGIAFAVAAVVPFLPYLPEGLTGIVRVFAYHGVRPLQVESVLATPLWIGQLLGLADVAVGNAFGSQYVIATGAEAIARLSGAVGLAALSVAYAAIWRRRARLRADPKLVPLAAAAALLAFVVSGKVLSPQFLIWLLPAVALLLPASPTLAGLLVASFVLTQIEFPANYVAFVNLAPAPVACVVARNLVLVAAFVRCIVELWRIPDRAAEEIA
jgi:hypothetical protein